MSTTSEPKAVDDWLIGHFSATETRVDTEPPRYTLHIDKADPCILVGAEFLRLLASTREELPAWQRNATLTCRGGIAFCGDCAKRDDWTDAVLRIRGTNRTVVYRIIERWHDEHNYYVARWPD